MKNGIEIPASSEMILSLTFSLDYFLFYDNFRQEENEYYVLVDRRSMENIYPHLYLFLYHL